LDAKKLSEIIIENLKLGNDIGHITNLKKFEKNRFFKNLAMLNIVDFINFFYTDSPPNNNLFSTSSTSTATSSTSTSSCEEKNNKKNDNTNDTNENKFFLNKSNIRTIGVVTLNNLNFFKNKIGKFAMGLNNIKK
jgi:hypothetical protein